MLVNLFLPITPLLVRFAFFPLYVQLKNHILAPDVCSLTAQEPNCKNISMHRSCQLMHYTYRLLFFAAISSWATSFSSFCAFFTKMLSALGGELYFERSGRAIFWNCISHRPYNGAGSGFLSVLFANGILSFTRDRRHFFTFSRPRAPNIWHATFLNICL